MPGGRIDADGAHLLVNYFLDNAQADARAFGGMAVAQGLKKLKNLGVVLRGDAGAIVLHPKLVARSHVLHRDGEAAGGAVVVLDGVAEQVGEDLLQAKAVGDEGRHSGADFERKIGRHYQLGHFAEQGGHVGFGAGVGGATHAGVGQQAVYQFFEAGEAAAHLLEVEAELGRHFVGVLLLNPLHNRHYAAQGRFEVVRGHVSKLVELLVALAQGREALVEALGHAVELPGEVAEAVGFGGGHLHGVVAAHHLFGQLADEADAAGHVGVHGLQLVLKALVAVELTNDAAEKPQYRENSKNARRDDEHRREAFQAVLALGAGREQAQLFIFDAGKQLPGALHGEAVGGEGGE